MINQYLLGHKVEVTDGKSIWYVAELSGFVVEVNLFSKELKCIWKIPDSTEACSYRSLFYYAHKLYVIPYYKGAIYVYDLYTAKYEKIDVKQNLELMGCIKRKQFLYAFGRKAEILKYNLEDSTVTYIDIQSELEHLKEISPNWFWTQAFVLNECIYIPISNTNIIIVLDQHDKISVLYLGHEPEKWSLVNIQADNRRFHAIYCKGEKDDARTYISEYDLNGRLRLKSIVDEKYSYQIYPFVNAVWIGDKWICLPYGRNEIVIRDKEYDEVLFEITNGIDFLNNIIQGLFCCSVWANDYMICSINQSVGSLICIDINDFSVNHSYLELKDNLQCLIRKSYQDASQFQTVIDEKNSFLNLELYIDYICNNENKAAILNAQTSEGTQAKEVIDAKSDTIWSRARGTRGINVV